MRLNWMLLAAAWISLAPLLAGNPQETSPEPLKQRWKASWISHPGAPRREFSVIHFRKSFAITALPDRFLIHVSGDNRYELFVNGARVASGPARGDLNHWRFESLDIAAQLRAGNNLIAAVVWNFAELAPMAQMTNEVGFILQGNGPTESVVNTDSSWRSFRNQAIEMIPLDRKKVPHYTVIGPGERIDGARYPWHWEKPGYDDSNWAAARVITPGGPRGIQDSPSRWMLVPSTIPAMEEKPERLARIVRQLGSSATSGFLQGREAVAVAANSRATILLDQGYLTTAYPEVVTKGGRGSGITLTYAEALWKDGRKGNRNETDGKEIVGYQDQFITDGGEQRLFRPLWWRTYRYLQLDVETDSEPLVIEDLRATFTAYPLTMRAGFESSDPELRRIWEVGWRTARLCAHETYMDCPYYEQLQYGGDTRIQALVSLYVSGDDRLVKNAIELLDESRTPEGLTQSRYPSFLPQYIPPFSLLWIGMMHDLWWYRGETDFLRGYLQGMRGVLAWFESRLSSSGLLGPLEWWNFVDWTKDFRSGVPPQEAGGQSSILSLQFSGALREAAELETALGSPELAARYRNLARKISLAVRGLCWDGSRRLLADTPSRTRFSQHASILGVLEGAVPEGEERGVMKNVLSDTTLTPCSFYFRFYLFRALRQAGLGEEYLRQLEPWRQMLSIGLSTWAETPEPTRSDCHAWSAHPNFDLLATVAGIEPSAPGFREVAIRPHLGGLTGLKASMPHPQGQISVGYSFDSGNLVIDISLPGKLTGWFYWRQNKVPLRAGAQHLVLKP